MKLYGDSLNNLKILDRTKYRGKGRPRKEDYTNFAGIQNALNDLIRKTINMARAHLTL